MQACGAPRGLLKRAFSEIRYIRCTKRRKLSSAKVFQPWREASSVAHPPYFLANAQWQNLQANSAASSHAREKVELEDLGLTGAAAAPMASPSQPGVALYRPNPPMTLSRVLRVYSQLSKSRLTCLMVLTAMSGVALSPLPATVPVLLSTALGTALCAASANTLNQLAEVPFDAQMARTRMRPLVRGAVSHAHAAGFAVATGVAGPAILLAFVNPVSAILGAANIGLYAGVYTTLKRSTVVNTWVGAVVGGIPPLMGWTACGGKIFPSSTYPFQFFLPPFMSDLTNAVPLEYVDNPLSALALFCLLFSWQFPHFNSLSHVVRDSYAQGGYKMLSVSNPRLNALVSLRHSAALLTICSVLTPLAGLTTWSFALTSLVPNAFLLRAAWVFWKEGTEKAAKAVFNISLWHLPVVLGLMMFHKQGMEWLNLTGRKDEKDQEDMIAIVPDNH